MESTDKTHPPALLTVKQVAEILQWNPFTIVKKAVKGELPGFKLGREWRFRQGDLVAWIEEKRNGNPSAHGQNPRH